MLPILSKGIEWLWLLQTHLGCSADLPLVPAMQVLAYDACSAAYPTEALAFHLETLSG